MKEENIQAFIKKIRKDNNLTQKELADKLGVTYQAVSKWERGINLPDISLLTIMSKEFNQSLDNIFSGEFNDYKKGKSFNKKLLFIFLIIIIIVGIILFINNKKDNDFSFKTIKTSCDNFNISGSIAYNRSKSSIYISNIDYCGEDSQLFNKIECTLYEKNGNLQERIDSYVYQDLEYITLDNFLKNLSFKVDNYSKICKTYTKDSLFLEIKALNSNNDLITYVIPLELDDSCK